MRARARLTIATRRSPLALWQARHVRDLLRAAHPALTVEMLELVSAGDRRLDAPLAAFGGKGLFLKELQQAVLSGEADLAVHSVKDMTVTPSANLRLAAVCARDDARDALVANPAGSGSLAQLPPGAVVGTCSLRRRCQLSARFPHLRIADLRGNVGSRLDKLARGDYDAVVLAVAGLKRLQLAHRISEYLAPDICLPAAGQAAIGIECRDDDAATIALLAPLNHADSWTRVAAERAVNQRLGGDCHLPLAAYAELHGGDIRLRALVGSADGSQLLRAEQSGARAAALDIAQGIADDLLARGAAELLADADGQG